MRLHTDTPTGGPRPDGSLFRLVVALGLCVAIAVACWVVTPALGVYMPPVVPLLAFGVIAAGTLVRLWETGRQDDQRDPDRADDPFP